MPRSSIYAFLKGIIWVCLGIILLTPLYVNSALFFPFIVGKTVVFSVCVEIMFLAFLALCWKNPDYRLRVNLVVILMAIYLGILTLASFLGNDFYHSFWSNNERSDGILLLIHLFLFVIVLTGFFRKVKDWLIVFDMFLIATVLVSFVALDQYLALKFPGAWVEHFLESSNGARLATTIGNAGYVAGYMVFGIFTAVFLFFKRKETWLRVAYGLVIVLEIFITLQTQTRGGMIALFIAGLIFIGYLMFFYFNDQRLKMAALGLIILAILGVSSIFIFKDSSLIKSNAILNRVASISLSDGSTNNRLVTWGIAIEGIKKKPLLGYGQENFYQVFDKYYTTKNSEQWFDRSHNMIFDRATTGGLIGLVSYLALLLVPFYFLWVFYKDKENAKKLEGDIDEKTWGRKYFTPVIFSLLILAYLIQNMFIFEALVTYVPLFLVISYVGLFGKQQFDFSFLKKDNFKTAALIVCLIIFIPSFYYFNLKPLKANAGFIKVLSAQGLSMDDKFKAFDEVINMNTLGNQEYRRHFFSLFEGFLQNWINDESLKKQYSEQQVSDFTKRMENYLLDQIRENPYSVSNYLSLMRFYNVSYFFDTARLDRSIEISNKAKELSSGRPQVYYETATSYYYRAQVEKYQKQDDKAGADYQLSINAFYEGAALNYYKYNAITELGSFISAVSKNQDFIGYMVKNGISGKKIEEVAKEILSWYSEVPEGDNKTIARESLLNTVNILFSADSGNKILEEVLNQVKELK